MESILALRTDKIVFQRSINKIMPILKENYITPNDITFLNTILRIMTIIYIYYNKHQYLAPLTLILITHYLDCLDGAYARYTGLTSKKGKYLDIVSDTILWIPLILIFLYRTRNTPIIFAIIVAYTLMFLTPKFIDTPLARKIDMFNTDNVVVIIPIIYTLVYNF